MSEVKRILTITPERQKEEQFVFKGIKCPVCKGQKQFHDEVGRNEVESRDCAFCQGTGSLQCKVQLTWLPDEIGT